MRPLLVMSMALCAALSACSSGSGGSDQNDGALAPSGASDQPDGTAAASGSRYVITGGELETVHSLSALDAIRRLRPGWLTARGPVSIQNQSQAGVKIYLDSSPQGGAESLQFIRANTLGEMRFLNSREATTRFGIGHPDGAIMLASRSGTGGWDRPLR